MVKDFSDHPYKAQVNTVLELYNFCKEFKTLPREGGLLEQDSYTMLLLGAVIDAVNERTANEQSRSRSQVPRGRGAR